MKIRRAEFSDIDSIMKIEKKSFPFLIREDRGVFLQRLKVFPQGFVVLESENLSGEAGAENGGKICGYLCSELWRQFPSSDEFFSVGHDISLAHCDGGSALYISSFAVLPEFRGSGNGGAFFRMALDSIEKEQKNLSEEILIVNENWNAARRIYSKNGFLPCFEIKGAFCTNLFHWENGIVMKRILHRGG